MPTEMIAAVIVLDPLGNPYMIPLPVGGPLLPSKS